MSGPPLVPLFWLCLCPKLCLRIGELFEQGVPLLLCGLEAVLRLFQCDFEYLNIKTHVKETNIIPWGPWK